MFCSKWDRQWDSLMTDETIDVLNAIEKSLEGTEYYPCKENVLCFLNMSAPVKYVIVGMDPYPSFNDKAGIPQATGRSFEVSELCGEDWTYKIKQSSLRNMLKAVYYNETHQNVSMEELRTRIAMNDFKIAAPSDWFDSLERQGVLFLNSTLTVKPGKPGSHQKLWEPFRAVLIPYLNSLGVSWMLWGNNAVKEVGAYLGEDSRVLTAVHPRMAEFVTENTFQYAKDIDWKGFR